MPAPRAEGVFEAQPIGAARAKCQQNRAVRGGFFPSRLVSDGVSALASRWLCGRRNRQPATA